MWARRVGDTAWRSGGFARKEVFSSNKLFWGTLSLARNLPFHPRTDCPDLARTRDRDRHRRTIVYYIYMHMHTVGSPPRTLRTSPRSLPLSRSSSASPPRRSADSPSRDEQRSAAGRSLASLVRSDSRNELLDPASKEHSHAAGEGLSGHSLHAPAVFRIYAFDRYGRSVFVGGDGFTVSVRGPSLVYPVLRDCGDGTYECEWQGSVTGTYLVSVLLCGEHVAGSPFAARVITPGHEPAQCRLIGLTAPREEGLDGATVSAVGVGDYDGGDHGVARWAQGTVHAVAGSLACFDIAFHDALGKPVDIGERELLQAIRAATASAVRVEAPKASSEDGEEQDRGRRYRIDGLQLQLEPSPATAPSHHCRASVSFDLAGTYHLCVYMHPGRVQPLNSPLRVVVRPGPPCASRCRSLATVTECRMLAGERRAFGVRTFDAFGNACDVGGAALRLVGAANGGPTPGGLAAAESARGLAVDYEVIDFHDGTYRIVWTSKPLGRCV